MEHDNGHWSFPEQLGPPYVGFLYLIRDNYMEKFYLGKKFFLGHGKLNYGKDSGWRKYKSSSKILKDIFKERPLDEFDFIALEQYTTKGTLSYAETWTLCNVEAPTNDLWYNYLIGKVWWKIKEPITERHKERLERAMNFEEMI